MKRTWLVMLLCMALCLAMVFSFAACGKDDTPSGGNGDNKDNNNNKDNPTVEKVTVTFKNGETVVDTIEINKGTAVAATTKTVTAPEGKQFKSWQKDGADYDFTAKVNENITLVATFEDIPAPAPTTFTITFKGADDKVLKTLQVEKKGYINPDDVPTAPDRTADHMTFVRWGLEGETTIGIDYDMEIIEDVTYVAVYETSKYTVTIKDADTSEVLDTQTIPYGGKVTPFQAPVGKEVVSVKLGDADFNYDTYTVEGNIEILVKLAVANRTVKITGEGLDLTFTVPKNGTLSDTDRATLLEKLATAPADGYFWSLDLSKLVNVKEDVTVTATKVAATDYRTAQGWLGLTTKTTDEEKTKYAIVLEKSGDATKNPAYKNWGTLFWQQGQYIDVTMNIAGTLQISYNTDKPGQHFTIHVYIDGVLFKVETIDSKKGGNIQVANVPAGQHDIRMLIASATFDAEGGEPLGEWAGFTISGFRFFEKKPDTCKVTFKNADGSVISSTTVKFGEAVAKPETDPTPAEGYLFSFWSADGKTAYDFSKALDGDLELIAVYERNVPSYTITFKDAEGGTVGTASVKEGANAELPAAPSEKLWTLATAEYVKMFNVTEAREVTLGTTDASNYNVTAGIYLNSEDSINKLKTNYGADFTTGNWGLQAADGRYVALPQTEGAYFTVTGNFNEFRFNTYLNAGLKCTYSFYVDDVLVKSLTYDNSKGDKGFSSNWVTVLDKTNMGAGQHTIKVVIAEGSGAVTAVRFGEVKK